MIERVVRCSMPGCSEVATHKVAAPWSDGQFSELKTYGLSCHDHLRTIFHEALERQRTCPTGPGEAVEDIGIYRNEPGKKARQLQRLHGLEENCRS